jgi:hypothetical protein
MCAFLDEGVTNSDLTECCKTFNADDARFSYPSDVGPKILIKITKKYQSGYSVLGPHHITHYNTSSYT